MYRNIQKWESSQWKSKTAPTWVFIFPHIERLAQNDCKDSRGKGKMNLKFSKIALKLLPFSHLATWISCITKTKAIVVKFLQFMAILFLNWILRGIIFPWELFYTPGFLLYFSLWYHYKIGSKIRTKRGEFKIILRLKLFMFSCFL